MLERVRAEQRGPCARRRNAAARSLEPTTHFSAGCGSAPCCRTLLLAITQAFCWGSTGSTSAVSSATAAAHVACAATPQAAGATPHAHQEAAAAAASHARLRWELNVEAGRQARDQHHSLKTPLKVAVHIAR
eukprot:1151616-Pelagomonas_calceolata.AAC.4